MCFLKLLSEFKVNIDWNDIYYAIENNLIDSKEIGTFAGEFLTLNPSVEFEDKLIDLAWSDCSMDETKKIIGDIILQTCGFDQTLSFEKWRYCILKNLSGIGVSNSDLINSIDEVYSNLEYPADMESFISYMPPKNNREPAKYTLEENQNHLIENLDIFLLNKHKLIFNE